MEEENGPETNVRELLEEKLPIERFVVLQSGNHRFIGQFKGSLERAKMRLRRLEPFVLDGVVAIQIRQLANPQTGDVSKVPMLSTIDMCPLPINDMSITPTWGYFPSDQPGDTPNVYRGMYIDFVVALQEELSSIPGDEGMITTATPDMMRVLDNIAQGKGMPPGMATVLKKGPTP